VGGCTGSGSSRDQGGARWFRAASVRGVRSLGTEMSWIGGMHNMQQFVVRQSVFAMNFGIIES